MSCLPPIGSWPYGFAVEAGYPRTRLTSGGPEAEVVFIGPAIYSNAFLQYIFGRWVIDDCCAQLVTPPKPYPLWCPSDAPFEQNIVYPDTWSWELPGQDCIVRPGSCGNPLAMTAPFDVVFKLLDDSSNPTFIRGFCSITVNYRYRGVLGDWPKIMQHECFNPDPEDPDNCAFDLPPIADGTFINVTMSPALTFDQVPGDYYDYHFVDKAGGGPETVPVNDSHLDPGVIIETNEIEVTWSNVPVLPSPAINENIGKVNDGPVFGYPTEAVLFSNYKIEENPQWSGEILYTVRYTFHAKTAPQCPDITYAAGYACNGKIGLWNRLVSDTHEGAGGNFGCHFIPVKTKSSGQPPYAQGTFHDLFQVCEPDPELPVGKCTWIIPSNPPFGFPGFEIDCRDGYTQHMCVSSGGTWTEGEMCAPQMMAPQQHLDVTVEDTP